MLTTSQEQRQEFVQLLRLTLVTDNQQRKMSEDRLNSIDSVVKTKLLLDVIMNETNEEVVQAAALMLRRLIIQIKIVSPDQASYLNEIKVTIPTLCLKEKNIAIRNKLVDVMSELIKLANFEESFTYDEAPQFFYQCISSNDEVGKLIAFRILDSSASVAIKFSDQQLCEVYKKISEVMSLDLATHNNLVVEAVRAFTNLTLYLPKNKSGQFFNTPFQILMHIVKTCNEPDCCVEILEELDELIESCREMIKPSLLLVVETLLAVLSSQQADEATRVGAMESLVLLAQKLKKEFQESCQPYYENIVDILMRHLMLVEDDPNWACSTEEDDEDDNDIASEAESSLDRIVCVVRGKAMFHIIKDKTSLLLSSKVWQHRYAALSTISCVAEGAHKQMKQYLPSIVDAIVPFMFDEHPRVVYACITCIGQLSTDFDEYLTSNFHEKIIPLMFQASEFYISFPKIRAHAVCCLST
ncbi:Importin-5 [Thelohanellus kitauei]|uniref:Importin-5 n=1 Tax=Thelohanellus kitauei TaxID=669202 RepID=A0A0C2MAU6_THEKT|nr:Importin-5 [Thelohanellus kitauei]